MKDIRGCLLSAHICRSTRCLGRIQRLWASGELTPVIVLYGHRRMGKSSVLRNLDRFAATDVLLVYLDMQDVTLVEQSGDFLLEIAEGTDRLLRSNGIELETYPIPTFTLRCRLPGARSMLCWQRSITYRRTTHGSGL